MPVHTLSRQPARPTSPRGGGGCICTNTLHAVLCLWVWLFGGPTLLSAQEVKIWEFSPYEVEIWYVFDSSLGGSTFAHQEFTNQLDAELERTFRAAWNCRISPLAPELASTVLRNFEQFTIQDMTASELVLVVSAKDDQTKAIRTFEAALEGLSEIHVATADKADLERSVARLQLPEDDAARTLISKCAADEGGVASLQEKLNASQINAALIPRSALTQVSENVRPLITLLPWQTDSLFRQRDKLFFVRVGMSGDDYTFSVRELDCPMQYLGPTFHESTASWAYAPRITTNAISKAFAPVARVEDAETKSASLRLRAGGLIVDKHNPAAVGVGDVMQPIVRRDDRNGVPTLLEPLSWTFAAITETDGVKMKANVYTYSGGPGLQGRKNRRTQRVLLRIRPLYEETDMEVVVRGTGRPQSGCFVYRRDFLTEEFEFLGRTDWRGRFTIPVPEKLGHFLPEEIRYQRFLASKEALAAAAKAEADGQQAGEKAALEVTSAEDSSAEISADPQVDPDAVSLRQPLTLLYLKSGDNILAKLPMVPGLKEIETAELPDDSRRLRAEAFVRGFQGQILDLIGLRNLLAAQIKLHLKNDKIEQAQGALEELRRLRNYNEMSDNLELIQRKMLDESEGPIPLSAKNAIDRMFQTTRDMLQKYMQDNLVDQSEQAVKSATRS